MRIRYMCSRRVIIVTLSLVAAVGASAQSTAAKKIDDTRLCRTCAVRVDKVASLADPVTAMGSSSVAAGRHIDDRYFV